MRILVMGAGALGGYFGARLQAAGHALTYVARGAHLEELRARGLRIESPAGDLVLGRVEATDDPSEAPTPEVVLFMVKNYDVEAAARRLHPALSPDTMIVTCQNGISSPERLGAIVGPERVVPGAVFMPADVREPGLIRHSAKFHRLFIGEPGGGTSDRVERFAEAVRGAGPDCEVAPDIRATLWEKFVLLSSFSAITALTRLDIGPIRNTPLTRQLLVDAVDEAEAVGKAVCPTLADDIGARMKTFMLERMGPDIHASMLDDLNRGKRIELNYLSGEIARLGREHGASTPVHAFVTAALQPYVDGPPDGC